MFDLTPRQPHRPLIWPDILLDVQDLLHDWSEDIYVVGGAVRDAMLHRPLHDIDLAVPVNAAALARKIANHFNGDFFILDSERDVGRALIDSPEGKLVFDVARFRGTTLLDDLVDRDFTINAMATDLKGDLNLLIDPLNGEADIHSKQLRRCASDALTDDPIRALRAVRQSVQLGMRIEPDTLSDLRSVVPSLKSVSPERVRDEVVKILALPKPVSALRIADSVRLLGEVLPEIVPLHGLQQSAPHVFDGWNHTLLVIEYLTGILSTISYTRTDNTAASFAYGMMAVQLDRYRQQLNTHLDTLWPNERPHRGLLMLAALLHDVGKPATRSLDEDGRIRFLRHESIGAELADRRAVDLRLSNTERQRLVTIVQNHMRPLLLDDLTPRAIHRFWRQLGDAGVDVCLLALADFLGTYGPEIEQDAWLIFIERIRLLLEAYYDKRQKLVEPPTLIDGLQLMRVLKLKSGPIVGELLNLIREGQVAGEIHSVEDALRLAREQLNKGE